MDYSSCLVAFSPCQRARIRNVLQPGGIRNYLVGGVVPNDPPKVSMILPKNDTIVPVGGSVKFQASATDNNGIARVEFYIRTTLNNSDYRLWWPFTTPPYWITASRLNEQTMKVYAKAYDKLGLSQVSDTVTAIVGFAPPPVIRKEVTDHYVIDSVGKLSYYVITAQDTIRIE